MKKHNLLFLFALTFLLVPTNTPVMAAKYSASEATHFSKKLSSFEPEELQSDYALYRAAKFWYSFFSRSA
ncbi:hypothetical protein HYQ57_1707 [Lactobacillus crispatus]|nr:hypothetical protein [Lactobacillus crispatus]